MTYLGFERRVLSGSSENSNKNLLLYEVFVVVSLRVKHAALPQILFLCLSIFVGLGHM